MLQHEVAGLAGVDQFVDDAALLVELDVGLGDGVLVFFPRREVERSAASNSAACFLRRRARALSFSTSCFAQMIADLVVAVAGIQDADFVDHAPPLTPCGTALSMKPYSLMRAKQRQRRDQTDVRTFRRFNRADTAVVRRVNVADFESGALARQTARPKSRQTPLVRDLRQRIGLIHELRQLDRSEELADRRHHRLGVDQVVRHGRRHFLVHAHLFLDGAFHADQADAELVFQQLADRANAAVAEVIDVVHRADVLAQLQQVPDGGVEVFRIERALVERAWHPAFSYSLMLNFRRPTREKSYLRGSKNMPWNSCSGRVERRRIAGTQLAVDFDQRFLRRLDRILAQRLADDRADVVALGEEDVRSRRRRPRESCDTLSAVSSVLASSRTSPVVMSTTSPATHAPSRSVTSTSISLIFAF